MILFISLMSRASKTRHAGLFTLEVQNGIILQECQQIIRFMPFNFGFFKKCSKPVNVIEKNLVLVVNRQHARLIIRFPFNHRIKKQIFNTQETAT